MIVAINIGIENTREWCLSAMQETVLMADLEECVQDSPEYPALGVRMYNPIQT